MLGDASPLLLFGAGKMGGAMLDRWLENGLPAERVTIVDPHLPADRRAAYEQNGASVVAAASEAGGPFRIVVLAVKPQTIGEVLSTAVPLVRPDSVIVSVAAGVRLERLGGPFGPGQPIVRAMPNTPAQIGMGMTVAVANGNLTEARRRTVDALLSAVGKVAWTEDESAMDAVTAVSGSGPAYVFLLAECLAEAGRLSGLPAELADTLARQTVAGAGALLVESPLPAATLRENVTSPGGTTAAAMSVLMAPDGLQQVLTQAVEAARKRSVELG